MKKLILYTAVALVVMMLAGCKRVCSCCKEKGEKDSTLTATVSAVETTELVRTAQSWDGATTCR